MRATRLTALAVATGVGLYLAGGGGGPAPAATAQLRPPVEIGGGMWGGAARGAFTPNGRRLVLRQPGGRLVVLAADTGRAVAAGGADDRSGYPGAGPGVWGAAALAVSPDGRSAAGIDNVRTVLVWDLTTGRATRTFRPNPGGRGATTVAYRPDGRRLAVADGSAVRLLDPDTGTAATLTGRRRTRRCTARTGRCWPRPPGPRAGRGTCPPGSRAR